jgi:hypothetical protein
MSDMQSMVDMLRMDENDQSYDDQKTAEELIDMLMGMIASGQITVDQAKEMIRNAPENVDEMSATGGGPGGATFTGGSGEQYAQALNQPKKKPKTETKIKKSAAGKIKKNYAVDKFGFTPAPSIPNRPSTGGFQYEYVWGDSESLQESYSKFKKAARERNSAGQMNAGISMIRKKLAEVHKMMEYLATLKNDLSTAGMVNETSHTKKSLAKMTEMITQIYAKHKKLK